MKLALAVPVPGSVTLALPALNTALSPLSAMLPVAAALASAALVAAERFSAKLSVPSSSASALMATPTTLLVSPGAKVSVPLVAA